MQVSAENLTALRFDVTGAFQEHDGQPNFPDDAKDLKRTLEP